MHSTSPPPRLLLLVVLCAVACAPPPLEVGEGEGEPQEGEGEGEGEGEPPIGEGEGEGDPGLIDDHGDAQDPTSILLPATVAVDLIPGDDDVDCFFFELDTSAQLHLETTGPACATRADPFLALGFAPVPGEAPDAIAVDDDSGEGNCARMDLLLDAGAYLACLSSADGEDAVGLTLEASAFAVTLLPRDAPCVAADGSVFCDPRVALVCALEAPAGVDVDTICQPGDTARCVQAASGAAGTLEGSIPSGDDVLAQDLARSACSGREPELAFVHRIESERAQLDVDVVGRGANASSLFTVWARAACADEASELTCAKASNFGTRARVVTGTLLVDAEVAFFVEGPPGALFTATVREIAVLAEGAGCVVGATDAICDGAAGQGCVAELDDAFCRDLDQGRCDQSEGVVPDALGHAEVSMVFGGRDEDISRGSCSARGVDRPERTFTLLVEQESRVVVTARRPGVADAGNHDLTLWARTDCLVDQTELACTQRFSPPPVLVLGRVPAFSAVSLFVESGVETEADLVVDVTPLTLLPQRAACDRASEIALCGSPPDAPEAPPLRCLGRPGATTCGVRALLSVGATCAVDDTSGVCDLSEALGCVQGACAPLRTSLSRDIDGTLDPGVRSPRPSSTCGLPPSAALPAQSFRLAHAGVGDDATRTAHVELFTSSRANRATCPFDTVLTVYRGADAASSTEALYDPSRVDARCAVSNDDDNGVCSRVTLELAPGEQVVALVTSFSQLSSPQNYQLDWASDVPLVAVAEPLSP